RDRSSDVCTSERVAKDESEMLERLKTWQHAKGAVPSSFDCCLALRGVQSLSARMSVHTASEKIVAEFLSQHDKVEAVHYPGLPDHPGHDIAAKQMSDFGGLMSFQVKGSEDRKSDV